MSRRLLLDHYDGGRVREIVHSNSEREDDLIIQLIEDCEPIVERARVLSELTPGKDFRHVAIIPVHVLDRAYREGWFNDSQAWKKWANNADNRAFRTWPGRL